jgi:cephalosporin hydroxylase
MRATARAFCREYHDRRIWRNTRWLGVRALKSPFDLWSYQEILVETRPDVVVETGSAEGGSALFLASVCEQLGVGRVLSIDVATATRPVHERITWLTGDSTAPETLARVKARLRPASRVMVVLDSDHRMEHVRRELELYAPLVTRGCYLVVEDTCLNGTIGWEGGAGPAEAVSRFLRTHPEFRRDPSREKFLMTFNPGGFLQRCA